MQSYKATKIHTLTPLTYELFFQNSSKNSSTSALVLEYIRKAWLIDPCTAIAIALATVIYGIEILLRVEREKKKVKIVREAGQELQEEQDAKRESDKKR